MENNEQLDDKTIQYLQMIQDVIGRMSTASAIFKGFCATTISGIFAISATDINNWILLLTLVPLLCFFMLDVYYLLLEKRFRVLYNSVREGKKELNFDLMPPETSELQGKKISLWYCAKSPSIYLFIYFTFR